MTSAAPSQPMCLFITGVSGVGKSTALARLRADGGLAGFRLHDMDEHGVPEGADAVWRKEQVSAWLDVAVALHEPRALVVAGVVEPEDVVEARADVAVRYCLLDVEDDVLRARLLGRLGSDSAAAELQRVTGQSPQQYADAVAGYAAELRRAFARCAGADIIDTSRMLPDEVADTVRAWLLAARSTQDG